jgi:hypothetical protein
VMAVLTAVGGPAIEVVLIHQFHLYHYTHPDLLGAPQIPPGPTASATSRMTHASSHTFLLAFILVT